MRADGIVVQDDTMMYQFQFTLPRGERRNNNEFIIAFNISFNPRSHEGSDVSAFCICSASFGFNPRSHEGSDNFPRQFHPKIACFNPRSHEGSDCSSPRINQDSPPCFNPRSHEGSDFNRFYSCLSFIVVSIHAPTRGATV